MDIPSIAGKKLIAFDLDGTLADTKTPMDVEMAGLISHLLNRVYVAIISGGGYPVFSHQISALNCSDEQLKNLLLFPVTGTKFYRHVASGWQLVYSEELTPAEVAKIKAAFTQAYLDVDYHDPATVYGEVVEDRGSQVTFSACGQQAPLEVKKLWRATQDRRPEIVAAVEKYLPDFEVKMPGYTSIDVTRKGIDKAYAIGKIESILNITPREMLFVGDALFEGGNDFAVIRTGIPTVAVANPEETKTVLRQWLA